MIDRVKKKVKALVLVPQVVSDKAGTHICVVASQVGLGLFAAVAIHSITVGKYCTAGGPVISQHL